MLGSWTTVNYLDGVHAVPDDDLIVHTLSVHCFCAPRVEQRGVEHWPHMWLRLLIVHNAMDDRE